MSIESENDSKVQEWNRRVKLLNEEITSLANEYQLEGVIYTLTMIKHQLLQQDYNQCLVEKHGMH